MRDVLVAVATLAVLGLFLACTAPGPSVRVGPGPAATPMARIGPS